MEQCLKGRTAVAVAFGCFIGWLLLSCTPMVAPGPTSWAPLYLDARLLFYALFAVSSLGCAAVAWRHPLGEAFLHGRPSRWALFGIVAVAAALGLANAFFEQRMGRPVGALLVASFSLSGAIAGPLQFFWTDRIGRTGRAALPRSAAVALAIGVASFCLCVALPTEIQSVGHSLLPLLSSIALLEPVFGRAAGGCCDASQAEASSPFPAQAAATMLALFAACVFNGVAEVGVWLSQPVVVVAVAVALAAAYPLLRGISGGRISPASVLAAATAVIAASTVAQGFATGAHGLAGPGATLLHAAVLIGECTVFATAWYDVGRGLCSIGTHRHAALSLACANVGVAMGAATGILLTPRDSLAYSALSIAAVAGAMLIFGIEIGARRVRGAVPCATFGSPIDATAFGKCFGLTEREEEILALWVAGHQISAVAERLCISENTVKTHLAHIYRKTGVSKRQDLLELMEKGLR